MKTRILLLLATAAAGVFASIAVASPTAVKGNPHDTTTTTGATTTTVHGKKKGKVLACHKLPNGHYVLVRVNGNSSIAKLKHLGDVLAGAGGTCPGPIQNQHTSSTTTTT